MKFPRELGGERVRGTCRFVYGSGKTFEVMQKIIKEDGAVAASVTGVAHMLDLAARRLTADPAGHPASPRRKPGPAQRLTAGGPAVRDAGRPASCVTSAQCPLSFRRKDLVCRSRARGALRGEVR